MATSLERSQPASAAARIGFGDILGDGFYSGAVGAAVVALFFLVLDTVRHEPFYTPSLMAGAVLAGAAPEAAAPVNVRVHWPDGGVERFDGLEIDRYTTLRRGGGRSIP